MHTFSPSTESASHTYDTQSRDVCAPRRGNHVSRRIRVPVIDDMAEHYPAMIREIYAVGRQRPLDYLVRNPAAVAAVEKYCIRSSDRILVVIEEMRERLISMGVPDSRIDLVSNTP